MAGLQFIDTHCHLDEEAFEVDRQATIDRAQAQGIVRMISIGTTRETSQAAVAIATSRPECVSAAVGIQPNYVALAKAGDWDEIVSLSKHPSVVAIGETGLDRYWDQAPIELQRDYFARHLQLARETGLPFVVHCREAEADVLAMLREAAQAGPLRGVMHSFTGSWETAEECLQLGLLISFAGMVSFKKSDALRTVATQIPLDRMLIETDAPYLAPAPHRGKRNEPAFVRHTADCLAQLRGVTVEEIARETTANARRLFGWPATGG